MVFQAALMAHSTFDGSARLAARWAEGHDLADADLAAAAALLHGNGVCPAGKPRTTGNPGQLGQKLGFFACMVYPCFIHPDWSWFIHEWGVIMIYPPKIWLIMVPHHHNMGKRTGNVWWICWRPKGVPKPAIAWWESRGNLLFLPTNTQTVVFWRTQEDLLTGVVSYGNGSKLYTTLHNKCFRSIWYQEWPISVRGDPAFEPTFCMLN